jgi:hypothetical protein
VIPKRGPGKYMTEKSLRDRCRRVPGNTPFRREAKRLCNEGDFFGALDYLILSGDITHHHYQAYKNWRDAIEELV